MSTQTAWLVLLVAGLFEAAWAIGLEFSDGLSTVKPAALTVFALLISMVLLAKAVEELPVGTAYAVWTGIGAVATAFLGIYLFDEPATVARLFFISVLIAGIAGLQLVSTASLSLAHRRDTAPDWGAVRVDGRLPGFELPELRSQESLVPSFKTAS